jgi:hypothetical protein
VKKCEEWLEENHPDLHEKLYSQGMSPRSAEPISHFCDADGLATI